VAVLVLDHLLVVQDHLMDTLLEHQELVVVEVLGIKLPMYSLLAVVPESL